jgi:hypothetical protein
MSPPRRVAVIGSIGVGVLFCVGVVLTARLVVFGLRTGELPPLLVAVALLLLGPVSVTLAVFAVRYATSDPAVSHLLGAGAAATSTLGVSCAALVTAVVFREGSRLGWVATGALVVAMCVCVVGATVTGGIDLRRTPTGYRLGYQVLQLGTLLWASVEAFVTWRMLRRRIRLGLARPTVVNRIALWSLASGAASIGMAIGFLATFFGLHYAGTAVELPIAILGLVAAGALWLSFLPPARYRAWVKRRHPEASAAAAAPVDPLAPKWPTG